MRPLLQALAPEPVVQRVLQQRTHREPAVGEALEPLEQVGAVRLARHLCGTHSRSARAHGRRCGLSAAA
eukprot:4714166-Prymnesium_polylepis.1